MGSSQSAGIITRTYKPGSIIYFAGDKSENIYILKSGRVILTSTKLDTGTEVKEDVRMGEFFGVKSSLGKYPREETAQTVGETVVLIFNLAEFERLILRNVDVVRKMLRVFSNQLRRIGKMVRSVLGEGDILNPDIELFRIGEYYYSAGIFQQAQYAYKKYMEYYPDGEHASLAMKRIKAIDSGEAMPGDTGFDLDSPVAASPVSVDTGDTGGSGDELGDFSMDEGGGGGDDLIDFDGASDSNDFFGDSGDSSGSLSTEMDDFLSDSSEPDEFDDFLTETDEGQKGGLAAMYDEANGSFSAGNYEEAMDLYSSIINSPEQGSDDDRVIENATFEHAVCQMKLRKQKDAIGAFSGFIRKYPKSGNMKRALYNIGTIFESAQQKDKAVAYYKKVASLQPADDVSREAEEKLQKI
jgi:TolA-binding protein